MRELATSLTIAVAVLGLYTVAFGPAVAYAQSGGTGTENTARENAEASAERQARAEIESLLARLCPGRCELVDVAVSTAEPELRGQVAPGFEASTPDSYEVEIERVEATVMMDSTLPENFQANIPRMAQFRLQELADDVVVHPELLEFPSPQLPPTPEGLPESSPDPLPPPRFEPEPESQPEPEPETEEEEPPEQQSQADEEPLWARALPWIALLMTLLILGGLILLILRRLEALSDQRGESAAASSADEDSAGAVAMPDTEALRAELTRSRSVLNQMLRKWLDDDPEEVAQLVRLVGPDILSDLRSDPEARPTLEVVSEQVASLDERIEPETAQAIARKARSRSDAQRVVEDGAADSEWDFLQGLTLGGITGLLENTSRRERGFVLTRLPPALRSRYLERLDARDRRRLLMEASSEEELSRTEAQKLAGRLRRLAEEMPNGTGGADGRAAMLVDMLEAMELAEQRDILEQMQSDRPDVAEAVLSRICLESSLPNMPDDVLADTIHRLPVETLATFLRGTGDDISEYLLDVSPDSKRGAVATELSLEIPTTRADFLEAREQFSQTVLSTLRRNGYDPAKFNADALRDNTQRSATPEVTG